MEKIFLAVPVRDGYFSIPSDLPAQTRIEPA